LVGEKAGGKKQKAEEYGIPIYEGRETIIGQFPSLAELQPTTLSKSQQPTTTQESLF
jgi:hypothetical protein